MKLIATLGSTKSIRKHKYELNNKIYEEFFSFMAIKKHYKIEDKNIIIIGTKATKEVHGKLIKNFDFVEINENNFEDIFAKVIKTIQKDCILDLTQSFKTISFGSLLGYIMSNLDDRKAKDIVYAQVLNNCIPSKEKCKFKFQSIKKYEEIIELVREINIFLTSWYVIDQNHDEFKKIHENLLEISKRLLLNNLNISNFLLILEKEIEKNNQDFLNFYLGRLNKEIIKLKEALSKKEYKKLFTFSKFYFEKNLLLQSVTMLFEAIGAYIEEKTPENFFCKKKDETYTKQGDKYKFRNCLKSKLSVVKYKKPVSNYLRRNIKIKNIDQFAKHYMFVDELRNNSAHAFINDSDVEDFKDKIKNEIDYFAKWLEK
ncbi:MAG: hypothetical protein GXO01_01135 [Epsilonproteobacteria bacterium]|nr:hypothetical protein [Campylobacterota bacterium]